MGPLVAHAGEYRGGTVSTSYVKGLHEVARDVYAYLQPDGGWGWNNAGLIAGEETSLLVDTLFDLTLTREMLAAMSVVTSSRPITTVVNTHANGDHCYGNEVIAGPGVSIIASHAAAQEMDEMPPSVLASMMGHADALPADVATFVHRAFGPFDFDGIVATPPTETFSGALDVDAGGRVVQLVEVGPAHTAGDILVWLPDERVMFAGDILFIEGTPIIWAGPVANWVRACDQIIALEPAVIVPGHGPLTDVDGVRAVSRYLQRVEDEVCVRHEAGLSLEDTTSDLLGLIRESEFASWGDPERLVINAATIWSTLEPTSERPSIPELFARMATAVGGSPR